MITIDWALLWDMGGHGPYVWGVYLCSAALIAAEAWALVRRHRCVQAATRGDQP